MTEDKETQQVCVLVLDYGSPRSLEDVKEYYTRIRRGHAPSDEELQGLRHKYERIGGQSQLMESTAWQVARLQEELQNELPFAKVTVVQAHKYIEPLIGDVAKELGHYDTVVVLMMNPYGTDILNASYLEPLQPFMNDRWKVVPHWADAPSLVSSWVDRVKDTLCTLPVGANPYYVCTAHSVPLMKGITYDGYVHSLQQVMQSIADQLQLPHPTLAWQSAGTGGEWLTPTVEMVTEQAGTKGHTHVVYMPIGFTCTHMEVSYDLDIERREQCEQLGMSYVRVPMPDRDTLFVKAMAYGVLDTLLKEG